MIERSNWHQMRPNFNGLLIAVILPQQWPIVVIVKRTIVVTTYLYGFVALVYSVANLRVEVEIKKTRKETIDSIMCSAGDWINLFLYDIASLTLFVNGIKIQPCESITEKDIPPITLGYQYVKGIHSAVIIVVIMFLIEISYRCFTWGVL